MKSDNISVKQLNETCVLKQTPRRLRWERRETEQHYRYYEAHLARDLFDQWVLTCVWGRRGARTGRVVHTPCASYDEACARLKAVIERRDSRGYNAVITH